MGCCASCFYYTREDYYDDYGQVQREHERHQILKLYREQYAREEAEGITVIPARTQMTIVDLEKVRAVFPPTPVRSTPPPSPRFGALSPLQ